MEYPGFLDERIHHACPLGQSQGLAIPPYPPSRLFFYTLITVPSRRVVQPEGNAEGFQPRLKDLTPQA